MPPSSAPVGVTRSGFRLRHGLDHGSYQPRYVGKAQIKQCEVRHRDGKVCLRKLLFLVGTQLHGKRLSSASSMTASHVAFSSAGLIFTKRYMMSMICSPVRTKSLG
jgi:hypothetical protein